MALLLIKEFLTSKADLFLNNAKIYTNLMQRKTIVRHGVMVYLNVALFPSLCFISNKGLLRLSFYNCIIFAKIGLRRDQIFYCNTNISLT